MGDTERATLELGGQRAAAFVVKHLRRYGHRPGDSAFRRAASAMLEQRVMQYGLKGEARAVWLASAIRHLDELVVGLSTDEGAQ